MTCESGSDPSDYYVFVYGTLKKGQPNHYLMEDALKGSAQLLADCQLEDQYPLVIASRFNIPFLLKKRGEGLVRGQATLQRVAGQVFLVDRPMLEVLDQLEEHPQWYLREEVPCKVLKSYDPGMKEGESVRAWCYFLPRFKSVLLEQPFLENYDTNGPHGLKYVVGRDRTVPLSHQQFTAKQIVKGEVAAEPLLQ